MDDTDTLGELAARNRLSNGSNVDLLYRLRGGMFHASSGRADNTELGAPPPAVEHAKVKVVTLSGATLQLSVPTCREASSEPLTAQDLLALVQKAQQEAEAGRQQESAAAAAAAASESQQL